MNAERLLAHYDRIADVPDAVPRLRCFILDLAVRGKLVEQDPHEESALVALGETKRHKLMQRRPGDPSGWLVARVGALLEFRYGKGLEHSKRLDSGPVPVFGSNGIMAYCETPLTEIPSVIIGRKGSAGALNVCKGPSWTTDVAYFVETPEFFELRYLLFGLRVLDLGSLAKGVKPGLSRSDAYDFPLSVPPLAEQRRIVAKVDELMALCDRLEAARADRETQRDGLVAASFARLNAPDPDPTTFRGHAAFVFDNLVEFTTRHDQIKAVRQTILNLAIRGKLVEQDPDDEPALELVRRIRHARTAPVVHKTKNGSRRVVPAFKEQLCSLPRGWKLVLLSDLVEVLNGRAYKRNELLENGTPVLRVGNLFTSNRWYYSNLDLEEHKYCDEGDLIYAWSASFGPFIWNGPRVIYHYHIWKLALHSESNLSRKYLYTFLRQKTREIKDAGHGVSMAHMTKGKMERLLVSLPPLAEQHRIVEKVDELMTLCDRLEASLKSSDDTRTRVFDAFLCEMLESIR